MDAARVVELASAAGLRFLAEPLPVLGEDPVLRYPLGLGEAAAVAHALAADGAGAVDRARHGPGVRGHVDLPVAAASLASFAHLRLDGVPGRPDQWQPEGPEGAGRWRPWGAEAVLRGDNATNPTVGLYPTADGRWIHLHGGAPHLAARILAVLGGGPDEVAARVARWDGGDLEEAMAAAGTCAVVARTTTEWREHPQGARVTTLPAVDVRPAGVAPALHLEAGDGPLAGLRVLDLGDGLAGPSCAAVLAAYGADVVQVVGPGRPRTEPFLLDTGLGKRSTLIDLRAPAGRAAFAELLGGAHVLCQSYRSGVLEALGFGAGARRALRPGLVVVSVNCYGPRGPWARRRGWEQLGQCATGLAAGAEPGERPRLAPAAVCDYLTGVLAAAGALRALAARLADGGGWDVEASLCQTAWWLVQAARPVAEEEAVEVFDATPYLEPVAMPAGNVLHHLRPPVRLEGDTYRWRGPPAVVGGDPPRWRSLVENGER